MKYIECPKTFRANYNPSLFLAGGITACLNWQADIVEKLKDTSLTLLNPRRSKVDADPDPAFEMEQITWEFKHLEKASAIMFWFSQETLCPITLYELGRQVGTDKKLFIGHGPRYFRKRDVRIQVGLVRGKRQQIHESLDAIADEIKEWAKEF